MKPEDLNSILHFYEATMTNNLQVVTSPTEKRGANYIFTANI